MAIISEGESFFLYTHGKWTRSISTLNHSERRVWMTPLSSETGSHPPMPVRVLCLSTLSCPAACLTSTAHG